MSGHHKIRIRAERADTHRLGRYVIDYVLIPVKFIEPFVDARGWTCSYTSQHVAELLLPVPGCSGEGAGHRIGG